MRLRWKKNKKETGLRAIGASPLGSYYHDGSIKYATVNSIGGGWRKFEGWYFVVGWDSEIPLYNSCGDPVKTEEEAKHLAKEYVHKYLADNP